MEHRWWHWRRSPPLVALTQPRESRAGADGFSGGRDDEESEMPEIILYMFFRDVLLYMIDAADGPDLRSRRFSLRSVATQLGLSNLIGFVRNAVLRQDITVKIICLLHFPIKRAGRGEQSVD